MFGHRYFGARYFGPRYWGPSSAAAVVFGDPSLKYVWYIGDGQRTQVTGGRGRGLSVGPSARTHSAGGRLRTFEVPDSQNEGPS